MVKLYLVSHEVLTRRPSDLFSVTVFNKLDLIGIYGQHHAEEEAGTINVYYFLNAKFIYI